MSENTPGPWTAIHHDWYDAWSIEDDQDAIAYLWHLDEETHDVHSLYGDAAEANAHLIAAAPELLAACEAIKDLRESTEMTYHDAYQSFCKARPEWSDLEAAIAKAKGEQ